MAAAIDRLAGLTSDGGPAIIVGAPRRDSERILNSVFVLDGGKVVQSVTRTGFLLQGLMIRAVSSWRHARPGNVARCAYRSACL